MVRFSYDTDVSALYITLRDGDVARTRSLDDSANLDLDAAGNLLGIEVLNPGSGWPLTGILRQYEIAEDDAEMLAACYPNSYMVSVG
jgi:uncharacterized protein YuzE